MKNIVLLEGAERVTSEVGAKSPFFSEKKPQINSNLLRSNGKQRFSLDNSHISIPQSRSFQCRMRGVGVRVGHTTGQYEGGCRSHRDSTRHPFGETEIQKGNLLTIAECSQCWPTRIPSTQVSLLPSLPPSCSPLLSELTLFLYLLPSPFLSPQCSFCPSFSVRPTIP